MIGVFMLLSYMLQLQIRMKLTVRMLPVIIILLIILKTMTIMLIIRMMMMMMIIMITWTFAGHQRASYRTYRDVKHTDRKLLIKSTILDGQTLDLSSPRMSYKPKRGFMEREGFGILRKNYQDRENRPRLVPL